ncbi:MAG: PAS domain-containing sensor histidine kinase [Mariniphaga sp.]
MKRKAKNQKNRYFHYQKEILNTISEPATFIDKKYKYVFVNSAFNKFYKWETKDLVGKTVDFIWENSSFGNQLKVSISKCLEGQNVTTQFEGMIPGGAFRILEMHFYPHLDKAGKIDGVISTSKDVTEHKQAEQNLKESEASLKELNATKDKLFSVIGHDLQGPLSNIIGFSELIDKGYNQYSEEEIRNYNKIIYQLSQSVSELLENLLTWSRSQRNRINIFSQQISMQLIIDKCHNLLIHNITHKQITFVNNIPPDTSVFADEEMITIVMRNLMSNAIKFTHRGGSISIFATPSAETITIGIRDTGIGIPSEKIDHIFKASSNHANTGTEGETGTGLGLIICKDFIEKNGGEIWAESCPGKGSVFYFSLPVAVKEPAVNQMPNKIMT